MCLSRAPRLIRSLTMPLVILLPELTLLSRLLSEKSSGCLAPFCLKFVETEAAVLSEPFRDYKQNKRLRTNEDVVSAD